MECVNPVMINGNKLIPKATYCETLIACNMLQQLAFAVSNTIFHKINMLVICTKSVPGTKGLYEDVGTSSLKDKLHAYIDSLQRPKTTDVIKTFFLQLKNEMLAFTHFYKYTVKRQASSQ